MYIYIYIYIYIHIYIYSYNNKKINTYKNIYSQSFAEGNVITYDL